tara:strand:- start:172 stop:504 length:333 start_codon:yes stop_codon:yes gene_type:complete
MTCGLNLKFDTAVDAVKEAFKAAVDTKDFDRSTLSEVWRHYQGLQTILEGLPEHNHEEFKITFPEGSYDPDYNINLFNSDPLSGNVEFVTTDGNNTFTVPEHEDDEKIVL